MTGKSTGRWGCPQGPSEGAPGAGGCERAAQRWERGTWTDGNGPARR